MRGELTDASLREKSGAGLNQCSPEEFAQPTELNATYNARFGFPFITAVRGHTRDSIIVNMAARIDNPRDLEINTALTQIETIAGFLAAGSVGRVMQPSKDGGPRQEYRSSAVNTKARYHPPAG